MSHGSMSGVAEHLDGLRLAADALDMDTGIGGDLSAPLHRDPGSPVFSLAPELLAYIMKLATLRKAEDDPNSWMYVALQDWLPDVHDLKQAVILSHVCGIWRNVALDTASLWTGPRLESHGDEISFESSIPWLERAKDAPLTVCSPGGPTNPYLSEPTFPDLEIPVLKGQIASRVQHLWSGKRIMGLTDMDTPLLESLHAFPQIEDLPMDLPRSAPKLRTLSLHAVNFREVQLSATIKYPFLSQLTRLAIAFQHGLSPGRERVMGILDVIERAPCLTDLAIRIVYRQFSWLRWSTERTALREKVDVPRLERLTLVGDQVIMRAVLDHLRLPERLELWLEPAVEGSHYPDEPERELQADFVARHLSQSSRIPDKLLVTHMQFQSMDFAGTHTTQDFVNLQLFHDDGHRLLSLPIRGVYSHTGYLVWLRNIAAALPWDALTETRLSLGNMLPPDELLKHTLLAGALATLHAGSPALARMAEIIRRSLDADSEDRPTGWLPGLRTLVAVGVRIEDLEAFLLAWKDVNPSRSFETLVLEACQIDSEAVNTILTQLALHSIHVLVTPLSGVNSLFE